MIEINSTLNKIRAYTFVALSLSLSPGPKHTPVHLAKMCVRSIAIRDRKCDHSCVPTCRGWDPHRWGTPAWASCSGPARDAATQLGYRASIVRDGSPTPTRPPRVRAPAPERSSSPPPPPPGSLPVEFHTHARHTLAAQRERGNIFDSSHGRRSRVVIDVGDDDDGGSVSPPRARGLISSRNFARPRVSSKRAPPRKIRDSPRKNNDTVHTRVTRTLTLGTTLKLRAGRGDVGIRYACAADAR